MNDTLTKYWPILFSLSSILISLVAQWAILGQRITAIEARQDRQSTAVLALQTQTSDLSNNYATLAAKLDAINDNVNYIRSRIDRVTQ